MNKHECDKKQQTNLRKEKPANSASKMDTTWFFFGDFEGAANFAPGQPRGISPRVSVCQSLSESAGFAHRYSCHRYSSVVDVDVAVDSATSSTASTWNFIVNRCICRNFVGLIQCGDFVSLAQCRNFVGLVQCGGFQQCNFFFFCNSFDLASALSIA